MKGPFHLMTFAEKLAHIKKCQAEGLEEIRKGSPSNLADIADHLDLWGPWMHKQLSVMRVAPEPNKSGLSHPCKDTCSGWKQGFDEGRLSGMRDGE